MKQRLSPAQLGELTSPQREYLAAWREKYRYPERLTVGQLMHFIGDHNDPIQIQRTVSDGCFEVRGVYEQDEWFGREDGQRSPIDPLWTNVVATLERLTKDQPLKATRDTEAKWNEWKKWLKTADDDFTQIMIRRQMWVRFNKIIDNTPEDSPLRRYGGPFLTWVAGMYVATQSSGVRRHGDTREDVVTLRRILEDMRINYDVVTEFSEAHVSVEKIEAEIDRLIEVSGSVTYYTNKRIAHLDPNELDRVPTFGDLHSSIDQLGSLLQKCHLILHNADLSLDIVEATAWPEIFRHPWIVDVRRPG